MLLLVTLLYFYYVKDHKTINGKTKTPSLSSTEILLL